MYDKLKPRETQAPVIILQSLEEIETPIIKRRDSSSRQFGASSLAQSSLSLSLSLTLRGRSAVFAAFISRTCARSRPIHEGERDHSRVLSHACALVSARRPRRRDVWLRSRAPFFSRYFFFFSPRLLVVYTARRVYACIG